MKIKLNQPWLTSSGVEIPTDQLKEISKSWDEATWEAYLKWYEGSFREVLVKPEHYEILGERVSHSVFDLYGHNTCPQLQSYCDQILKLLSPEQETVLRKIFFEGKTERQIAFELKRSPSFVSKNKFKALSRLKVNKTAALGSTQHLMREAKFFDPAQNNSVWETKNLGPLKKSRAYKPENYDKELLNHPIEEVRSFFRASSLRARQYVYLRYWCGFSINEIARRCSVGVNTVDQVIDATVFKLKSALTNPELITQASAA
ncbi:MAG: hypothetical protein ACK4VO_11345 [Pseudobdellovibrio sp.]